MRTQTVRNTGTPAQLYCRVMCTIAVALQEKAQLTHPCHTPCPVCPCACMKGNCSDVATSFTPFPGHAPLRDLLPASASSSHHKEPDVATARISRMSSISYHKTNCGNPAGALQTHGGGTGTHIFCFPRTLNHACTHRSPFQFPLTVLSIETPKQGLKQRRHYVNNATAALATHSSSMLVAYGPSPSSDNPLDTDGRDVRPGSSSREGLSPWLAVSM